MKVFQFFVCLCLLLLKGNAYAHAGMHRNEIGYAAKQHIEHNDGVNLAAEGPGHEVTRRKAILKEPEAVIYDDLEDEDEGSNTCFSDEDRLPARFHHPAYCSPSYLSIVHYPCLYFKAAPSLFGQVAPRYILQGVLRI